MSSIRLLTLCFAATWLSVIGASSTNASENIGVGASPVPGAIVLFDGSREMLDEKWTYWEGPRFASSLPIKWKIVDDPIDGGTVLMTDDPVAAGGKYGTADIVTKQKFRDFRLHIEFMVMKPGGNSGVYLQNRYEIQVLDGDRTKHGMGAVINETPSPYHAYNGTGTWNAYDIVFRAARFQDGQRTEKALVTMYFNGKKVHLDQEITKVWGGPNSGIDGGNDGGNGITDTPGGIKLQCEGHDVRYRNIWLNELNLDMPTTNVLNVAASIELPATDDGLPGAGPIRRYDWFKNLWNKRRSAWQDRIQQDRHAVVFLGDSITQGWGDHFKDAFDEMKVANRGISGDTTRGMLIRLDEDVLALQPAGIVMLMGTNDLEEGASPETIATNVRLILEKVRDHDAMLPVILSLVFPSSATKKRPAEQIRSINQLYQQIAREFPQVTVVDTWTLFANADGDAKVEEFPDLLHPNDLGYAKWGKALIPLLETVGLKSISQDDFIPEPGFRSLFNGKDLTGWGYRATPQPATKRPANPKAPARPVVETNIVFDGKTVSSDGRYVAHHGRLVVTTPIEGRRIQQLWTTEEFGGDFTLRLEFRATPNADSGIFIRQPQLQCRDYLLAGPYKNLTHYRPQDWNEIEIVVTGNSAHCTCNGEVLEEAFPLPETGPIGLEGDRGQIEYRRIRIKH